MLIKLGSFCGNCLIYRIAFVITDDLVARGRDRPRQSRQQRASHHHMGLRLRWTSERRILFIPFHSFPVTSAFLFPRFVSCDIMMLKWQVIHLSMIIVCRSNHNAGPWLADISTYSNLSKRASMRLLSNYCVCWPELVWILTLHVSIQTMKITFQSLQ